MITRIILFIVTALTFSIPASAQMLVSNFKSDNGLWGYVNIRGEVIIPATYSAAKPFGTNGIALVRDKKTKEYFYIDIKGNPIKLNHNPSNYKNFYNDRAIVINIDGDHGAINSSGELVIDYSYEKMDHFNSDRTFAIDKQDNIVLLDIDGNSIDISQHNITDYNSFQEGMAGVKIGELWGFIDTDGNLVVKPQFLKVGKFSAGLAWIRDKNEQIGYINKQGEMVIEPAYLQGQNFDEISGRARVKSSEGWFYINSKGEKLLTNADHFYDFSDGYLRADDIDAPGVFGYKDKDGEWVIKPQYEACSDFYNGYARIRVNKLWGLIDKENKIILEPKYVRLEDFELVE